MPSVQHLIQSEMQIPFWENFVVILQVYISQILVASALGSVVKAVGSVRVIPMVASGGSLLGFFTACFLVIYPAPNNGWHTTHSVFSLSLFKAWLLDLHCAPSAIVRNKDSFRGAISMKRALLYHWRSRLTQKVVLFPLCMFIVIKPHFEDSHSLSRCANLGS